MNDLGNQVDLGEVMKIKVVPLIIMVLSIHFILVRKSSFHFYSSWPCGLWLGVVGVLSFPC
jgi:hypothetical protein